MRWCRFVKQLTSEGCVYSLSDCKLYAVVLCCMLVIGASLCILVIGASLYVVVDIPAILCHGDNVFKQLLVVCSGDCAQQHAVLRQLLAVCCGNPTYRRLVAACPGDGWCFELGCLDIRSLYAVDI